MRHAAPVHLSPASWLTWVFAFVFYDLCYYWQHRLGHTVGLFWASHSVHHQSEEFNLTTALRQPGTGAFTNWIFYVPMALAGVPVGVFLMVGVIQLFYQFWPHTQLIGRLGVLDRWIQTPSNHRVHHAQNDIYLDRNYVGVFLLGTICSERFRRSVTRSLAFTASRPVEELEPVLGEPALLLAYGAGFVARAVVAGQAVRVVRRRRDGGRRMWRHGSRRRSTIRGRTSFGSIRLEAWV